MEKYSVLMSVYCKETPDYLIESIESMLHQTVKPEQIVIVKDGPLTSKLDDVIKRYEDKYDKIFTIISLEKNSGLGHALNVGLMQCRNEIVARMDSDDISFPERCEKQLKEFEENANLSACGTQILEFENDINNIIGKRFVPIENEEIIRFSHRRSPFNHPTVMFKKSDILDIGGYPELGRKEDLGLFVNLVNSGYEVKNLEYNLLFYRTGKENRKRRKTWVNCREYIQVMMGFYKQGIISKLDISYVILGQIVLFICPIFIAKRLNNIFLRNRC